MLYETLCVVELCVWAIMWTRSVREASPAEQEKQVHFSTIWVLPKGLITYFSFKRGRLSQGLPGRNSQSMNCDLWDHQDNLDYRNRGHHVNLKIKVPAMKGCDKCSRLSNYYLCTGFRSSRRNTDYLPF